MHLAYIAAPGSVATHNATCCSLYSCDSPQKPPVVSYRPERGSTQDRSYLRASPGKPVEQPASGLAVFLVQAVLHDADDDLVRHELSLRHRNTMWMSAGAVQYGDRWLDPGRQELNNAPKLESAG